MGYNTAVIICNDQLHDLAKDPNAGELIQTVIHEAGCRPGPRGREKGFHQASYGAYSVGALPPRHADECQLVLVGRNSIDLVGTSFSSDPLEALRQAANKLGYDLRKKPERKTT
jgi:hypothetical protein